MHGINNQHQQLYQRTYLWILKLYYQSGNGIGGYVNVRKSLYTLCINSVTTILYNIDMTTILPRYEGSYMV